MWQHCILPRWQMSKRIIIIRHGDDPPDDRVYTYFHQNGFEVELKKPFKGDDLPNSVDDVIGSVIHGGPFNVFETKKYPFLNDEHSWIEQCIDREIPLLGICQGAQSIAHTLGAEVGPRNREPHEFGYYSLYPTEGSANFLSEPMIVAQAHFHGFRVPKGGELLAYSDLFPYQAFRYGKSTYAFQFHAEVTIEGFRRWQKTFTHHWGKLGSQNCEEQDQLMLTHDFKQAQWFYRFLEKLFPIEENNSS